MWCSCAAIIARQGRPDPIGSANSASTPSQVCACITARSSSSSEPRLFRMSVGTRDLPMSCSSAAIAQIEQLRLGQARGDARVPPRECTRSRCARTCTRRTRAAWSARSATRRRSGWRPPRACTARLTRLRLGLRPSRTAVITSRVTSSERMYVCRARSRASSSSSESMTRRPAGSNSNSVTSAWASRSVQLPESLLLGILERRRLQERQQHHPGPRLGGAT